jgi:hypothetical protein
VLLPSTIVRQVLFDATEFVPAWALPRAEAGPTTTAIAAKPMKRPRRTKATETSTAKPATAAARGRTRKSSNNPKGRP